MSTILEELVQWNQKRLTEFLDMIDKYNLDYVEERCEKCVHHSGIDWNGRTVNVCNDTWSGGNGIGEHVFYGETADLCAQLGGYKEIEIGN